MLAEEMLDLDRTDVPDTADASAYRRCSSSVKAIELMQQQQHASLPMMHCW